MPAKPVYPMIGLRFGRQVVLERAKAARKDRSVWLCRCDCGRERIVDGYDLRSGHSTQCKSCNGRRQVGAGPVIRNLLHNAKARAKKLGQPCDLTLKDIVIPERCPLLGIPIKVGAGPLTGASPSLDRIRPSLGYVKGNVIVISFRANTIKSDSTPEELRLIASNVERLLASKEVAACLA